MENEYMERGYLLPPGCKDLHDALKLEHPRVFDAVVDSLCQISKEDWTVCDPVSISWHQPPPLPPPQAQIVVPPETTVKKLAALLGLKPFIIVGDLMKLGMFATAEFLLDFKTISAIAKLHGFTAIRVD